MYTYSKSWRKVGLLPNCIFIETRVKADLAKSKWQSIGQESKLKLKDLAAPLQPLPPEV